MHVGAQVARVGPPHPDGEFLGGQDVRGLLQGGLGRAVAAPPRVGLHRRVRGDVQHRAAAGAQQRQQQLGQRDGRDHVHLERGAQLVHRVVGQRGQRAGAQRARVVHQQVQPARGLRRPEQRGPVRGVGDVARDGGDGALDTGRGGVQVSGRGATLDTSRGGALDTGRGGVQVSGVPGVEDEVVALAGQAGGQRPAQSAGGPRNQSQPGSLGGSSPRAMPSRGGLGGSSPRAMPSRGGLGGSSPRASTALVHRRARAALAAP